MTLPKNRITLLLISLSIAVSLLAIFFSGVHMSHAQTALSEEAITSFNSRIAVNADNAINVTEIITYNSGGQEKHGIFRDIIPLSSQNRRMKLENITVKNEQGAPYQFQTIYSANNVRLKIGDPNVTFIGQKTYIISYRATNATAQLKDIDEIYWNVTGNGWQMPIYEATATIVLPNNTTGTQSACYFGPKGSNSTCPQVTVNPSNTYIFAHQQTLNPNEGLTVAVGFAKGVLTPYSSTKTFLETYWAWFICALLPILTLIFSLRHWYKFGRDAKGSGVIIPQYEAPDGLTPIEMIGIVKQKGDPQAISAEMIYLATMGYISIKEIEQTFMGFSTSKDYELDKRKDFSDLPNEFDKKLLSSLFADGATTVTLSALKNKFYKNIPEIINGALDGLLQKEYYSNLGGMKKNANTLFLVIFFAFWASGFFGGMLSSFISHDLFAPFAVSLFLSIMFAAIISHFYPAKTAKGIQAKEHLLGLKMYLQIAEKSRLEFHNAPEKKPELFEALLPFAMVLGVSEIWAKEFADIYTTPPTWYTPASNHAFNIYTFNTSLTNFNSFAASTLNSSPSSGGSGGGGHSGGGGGGGGGGSW